jgi:hypothetical protein
VCGKPIGDNGEARIVRIEKQVNPDLTEQTGNPLDIEWRYFCARHLADFDAEAAK